MDAISFPHFVEWAFMAIVSGAAVFAVNTLRNLDRSVNELNVQIAIIIEKTASHERWLERHDEEISKISKG